MTTTRSEILSCYGNTWQPVTVYSNSASFLWYAVTMLFSCLTEDEESIHKLYVHSRHTCWGDVIQRWGSSFTMIPHAALLPSCKKVRLRCWVKCRSVKTSSYRVAVQVLHCVLQEVFVSGEIGHTLNCTLYKSASNRLRLIHTLYAALNCMTLVLFP